MVFFPFSYEENILVVHQSLISEFLFEFKGSEPIQTVRISNQLHYPQSAQLHDFKTPPKNSLKEPFKREKLKILRNQIMILLRIESNRTRFIGVPGARDVVDLTFDGH